MNLASSQDMPSAVVPASTSEHWVDVCDLQDLIPSTGVAALIDEEQIAIVRSPDGGRIFGISNFDPFSNAFVISRGIVGDRAGVLKIASPIYKQSFNLETGQCLDDASVVLPTYPVRVRAGRVEVMVAAAEKRPNLRPTAGADAE